MLTPQHFDEGSEQQAFFAEHLFTKGEEAARALEAVLDPERSRGRRPGYSPGSNLNEIPRRTR